MKFIQTVPYYNTSHMLLAKEDYMALQVNVMAEQGFESVYLIYDRKKKISVKNINKNLNPKVEIVITKSFLKYLLYLYKNRKSIIFANDRIFSAFICSYFTKKSFFMSHQSTLPKSAWKKAIFAFFVKRFKHIKVSNIFEEQELIKIKVNPKKISYIPLVIDHEFFSRKITHNEKLELRKKYGIEKEDKVILFLSTIRKFKNPYTVLRALQILKSEDNNIKLLIVGADKLKEENAISVAEYAKQLKIEENIVYTGNVTPDEITKIFNIVDIGVNSSYHEGQCLVVYEMASAGIPLCLSNIGSFISAFKNTALYHDPEDHVRLAKNIQKYLNNTKISEEHVNQNRVLVKKLCDYNVVKNKILAWLV